MTIGIEPAGIEADIRELGDKIKNHVVIFQRRRDCPAYWLEVLEPSPSLHAHLIVATPKGHARSLLDSLTSSSVFGAEIDATRVYDMPRLANYLSKYATPQAKWGRRFRRVSGSHRMEGDRVRLSRELERDMIAAGVAEPFKRSYVKRFTAPQIHYRDSLFDGEPLPVLAAPQRPKGPPRPRLKIAPPSLPLDYAPTVADLLAGLAETHRAAGELVGLSRPQATNIINYQFNPSPAVAQRVLELARAA